MKGAACESSEGSEEHAVGNYRKLVAKSLAVSCSYVESRNFK